MKKKISKRSKVSGVRKKTSVRASRIMQTKSAESRPRPSSLSSQEFIRDGARGKRVLGDAGPYYAVGAAALAFTFLFFFFQPSDRRGHDAVAMLTPVENKKVLGRVLIPGSLLEEEFQRVSALSHSERVNYWSSALIKNPSVADRLREFLRGEVVNDSAPIVPLDFDCTTYVETVAALSRSEVLKDFLPRLMEIRYRDAQPSFQNRNHFVEGDWIPNNERAGVVKDITLNVAASAQVQVQFEERTLHRGKWIAAQAHRQAQGRELAAVDASEVKEVRLPYLPLEDFHRVMEQVPDGTVVNFVREKSPQHAVLVSHQGLLIRSPEGELLLRHASTGGRMRTEFLAHYVDGMLHHNKKRRRWGWLGVNLNQISSSNSSKILRKDPI